MKESSRYSILGTVIYGLFVIVPIAILFLLLVKVTEILEKLAVPLGMESSFGAAIALILIIAVALTVILSLGFVVGTIMRRVVSYEKFESVLLNEIPGYQIVANIARGFSGGETGYTPALIELHGPGVAVLGFIMEEHEDNRMTVYIPSAPVLTVGTIFVVDNDRVSPLEAGAVEVADCIAKWGIGADRIVPAGVA